MKEMGGYLPLELCQRKEYYQYGQEQMLRVNCGRAAIYAALLQFRPKRVILPYFICPTVKELVAKMNIPYIEYSITEDFLPQDIQVADDDCIILVSYFGLINREQVALKLAEEAKIIVDNTQAFYAQPIFHPNILNVYSCRKFFGVSDGGYLIGQQIKNIDFKTSTSWEAVAFLGKSLELGTNAAYEMKKNYEAELGTEYTQMSILTRSIMGSIDYTDVAEKRRNNFAYLNKLLGQFNELQWELELSSVPYTYPFMIRREIRDALLSKKIYIPILWKDNIAKNGTNSTESNFSKWIYHLPIAQRYDTADMRYLANVVEDTLKI